MARGLSGVIYGLEGMGKTSLGLQFPGPVFCKSMFESGYDTLLEVPPNSDNTYVKSFQQLCKETSELRSMTKGTLLLDSCTGLQRIIFDHATNMDYQGVPAKFYDYSKGPRQESVRYFQGYLDMCDSLLEKGINVIFLAHQVTTTIPNTMGADYLSHVIAMDGSDKGGLRNTLTAWASFIFFLNKNISITQATEKDRGNVVEGKANNVDSRYIYTQTSPTHSAKNRWDMPPVIPMGKNAKEAFDNLWKHVPERFKTPKS